MLSVRRDAEDVALQEDYLEELQRQTISSPNMDGMPKGSAQGDAAARLMIRKQQAEAKLEQAKRQLERSKKAARRVIAKLDVRMARFCEAYFIEGEKLEAASAFAGVCVRTGSNYAKMVKWADRATV